MYSRVICKLVINDILMSFLHCKALRTAMYNKVTKAVNVKRHLPREKELGPHWWRTRNLTSAQPSLPLH